MAVQWKPKDQPTITPALPGGRKLIDFMTKVLGAKAERIYEAPGGMVAHAEIRLGESLVMTGDPMGPEQLSPSSISVYVP